MKLHKRYFCMILALLLALTPLASCNSKDPIDTTAPIEISTTEAPAPNEPDPTPAVLARVVNGTFSNGKDEQAIDGDTSLTLTAANAPKGFSFSHWENSSGQTVSEEVQFEITVSEAETFKAYYEVYFSDEGFTEIFADASDWMQGGYNGQYTSFMKDHTTRVSFKEPLFMEKGSSLVIDFPRVQCLENPGNCPSLNRDEDCVLMAGIAILTPTAENQSGIWYYDYDVESFRWGASMTATEDCYVTVMLKWDKHGGVTNSFLLSSQIFADTKVYLATPSTSIPVATYWESEVNDAIEKIEANRASIGEGVSEFFYFNDIHWTDNAQYSPALINYIAERTSTYNVVFGGDVIRLYNPTKQGAIEDEIEPFYAALTGYTKVGEALRVFSTLGNHDRNGSSKQPDTKQRLSEREAYEAYLKRVEEFGTTTDGNPNQGYFDDTENKVRYIQFYFAGGNNGLPEDVRVNSALTWAEKQILALDEEWTVVLITHSVFWGYNNSGNEFSARTKEVIGRILALQGKADATIAAWIGGHVHEDHFEIAADAEGNKLQLISLNCDAYGNSNAPGGVTMMVGDTSEQSISFMQVDVKNETLYLTRIGAGKDYTFTFGSKLGEPTVTFE